MSESDACKKCGKQETLYHKLTECNKRFKIWEKFKCLFGRINRCHTRDLEIEYVFCRPSFLIFPSARRKFTILLIAQSLFILKNEQEIYDET